MSSGAVQALRDGQWNEAVARQVAPVLALKASALAESGNESWQPAADQPRWVRPIQHAVRRHDGERLPRLGQSQRRGDAPSTPAPIAAKCSALIAEKKLTLKLILLTHTHGDHIFDLDRLHEKTGAPAYVGDREPLDMARNPLPAGRGFEAGALKVTSGLTWGHSKGGITFVVKGLSQPVAVVGDAVFAGSMGGGGVSYGAALATNREQILSLSDDTVIASGHGPLTTVGEHRKCTTRSFPEWETSESRNPKFEINSNIWKNGKPLAAPSPFSNSNISRLFRISIFGFRIFSANHSVCPSLTFPALARPHYA